MRSWIPLYALALATAIVASPRPALAQSGAESMEALPGATQTSATSRKHCPDPALRKPIQVGPNAKVGSGARAKAKAKSTALNLVGGLLGGGGNRGGGGGGNDGPRLAKCKIKDSEMTVFTDPETGIALKVGAKRDKNGLVVFSEVDKSSDNGTFQAAVLENANGDVMAPQDVDICELWGEWKLTVSWTKTTYVDNQVVKQESGGWQKTGLFTLPGSMESGDGIWQRLGFSNASHGARMVAMRYRLPPPETGDGPLSTVIHVTRPGRDPVDTVPFGLNFDEGPDGIVFTRERPSDCPDGDLLADLPRGTPPPPPASNPAPRPPETTHETPPPRPEGDDPRDEDEECPWPTEKIAIDLVDAEAYNFLYGTTQTYTDLADIVRILTNRVAPHYDPRGECGRCIRRLDLWGHGDLAGGYISFGPNDAVVGKVIVGADIPQKLAAIGQLMCVGGEVVMNQCKSGYEQKGTDALQILADNIGVTVSGPPGEIEGCRIFGGILTDYKNVEPAAGVKTPADNSSRDVAGE
ncbi:MAG: hypothetical protein WC213_00545 [Arenimonas sp.]|jgi:hypothetical protein